MGRKDRKKKRRKRGSSRNRVRNQARGGARPYVALMLRHKEMDEETCLRLKGLPDETLDAVLAHAKSTRADILGPAQPQDRASLGGSLPTYFSRDTLTEVRWAISTALQFHVEIADFLKTKEQIEQKMLKGDWASAEEQLLEAQARLGCSMWGIETDLLIKQHRGGLEANRKLLKSITEGGIQAWSRVLCVYFSHKAEETISSEEYNDSAIILDASPEEGASRVRFRGYLRFRVTPYRYSGQADLGFFLHMEEVHSVFDRYLMLQRVVLELLDQGNVIDAPTAQRLRLLRERVSDQEIGRALVTADPSAAGPLRMDDGLFSLVDRYTSGEYESVARSGMEMVGSKPLMFEYYELTGKAIARTGIEPYTVFPENSPGDRLLKDTVLVTSRGPDWPKAIARLQKLAHQFYSSRIGPLLNEFILEQEEDGSAASNKNRLRLVASEITPRACLDYPDTARGLSLLSKIKHVYPRNSAVLLFDWVLNCVRSGEYVPPPTGLPPARARKYQAFILEQLRRYEEALVVYAEGDREGESSAMVIGDALKGRYRCYLKLNRLGMCATSLAQVGVEKPHLVAGATVRELLEMYPYKGKHRELKRNIAWPVLFAFAQFERHQPPDQHRLYQVLDDFLTAWDVTRPSELKSVASQFGKPLLVYLLRMVCLIDVLDSFIWYDSQEEVETERGLICEWLSELDPERRIEYSAEQGELKQRAIMRELAHQSERSKIYVDADGILSSLPEAAWDRIVRSLAYSVLSSELRQGIDIQKRLEDIGINKDVASKAEITFIDEGYLLFRTIFEDLQQRFLHSNEFGLDSNLSQRVRHGTLAGAIRPIFDPYHFVTHKNARGEYAENTHWLQKCHGLLPDARERVVASLRQLSQEVDDTIELVRNRWIQIKGPSNEGKGYFDFDFSVKQIDKIYKQATAVASSEAYVTVIFEELWARTAVNLQVVRNAITGELLRMFSDVLNKCEKAITSTWQHEVHGEFRTAVTSCKTALAHGLNKISEWFYIDDTQRIADFSIAGLIDSLLENINRFADKQGLALKRDLCGVDIMKGSRFRALWDLLFILFDNVLKHSELEHPTADLRLVHENEKLVIEISNPLGAERDRAALNEAIESYRRKAQALANSRLVKGEGGSGFAKMHKIIKFDFRCLDYAIDPSVGSDDRFRVSITMQFQGLKDENAGHRRR